MPRQEKSNNLTISDLILLDLFMSKKKIDLSKLVHLHMEKCCGKNHSLPYLGLVKKMLEDRGVYEPKEEQTHEFPLEVHNLKKMGH